MTITDSTKKKKFIFKKKTKKQPQSSEKIVKKTKSSVKIPENNDISELTYDNVDESVEGELKIGTNTDYNNVNFSLINKLPKIYNQVTFKHSFNPDLAAEESDEGSDTEDPLDNNKDIDTESLLKDNLNGKTIYYDYDKNLIYDMGFKIIGEINEDGEINIDDSQTDYTELGMNNFNNNTNNDDTENIEINCEMNL